MDPRFDDIPVPKEKKSYKKTIIIMLVILLVVLSISGYAYYQYAKAENVKNVALAKKQAEKDKKSTEQAKLREGTIEGYQNSIKSEYSYSKEINERLIFANGDALQREGQAAATLGSDNVNF